MKWDNLESAWRDFLERGPLCNVRDPEAIALARRIFFVGAISWSRLMGDVLTEEGVDTPVRHRHMQRLLDELEAFAHEIAREDGETVQ